MRYMMLIYWDETPDPLMSQEELEAQYAAYRDYTQAVNESGHFLYGDALQPTATGQTVRVKENQRVVTDGPFAETKEHLGGIYVMECANMEEALALAARIPHAKKGSIEVRPILEY